MTLRALGGAPLLGVNLSRYVYLDEAGVSGQQEPWLVVGGPLVHGDTQLDKLYSEIEAVAERHIPQAMRDDGLIIHAGDIYGGNSKFDKKREPYWTDERRFAILRDLAKIPNKANVLLTGGPMDMARFPYDEVELPETGKRKQPIKKPSKAVAAQALCYLVCLVEVDQWLRKHAKKENCMVIVEDNNEARAAIKEVHQFHQNKYMQLPDDLKAEFPLKRIREDPAFMEKRPDHPLVLADFVAFVLKRFYMGDPKISPFFDPWKERYFAMALSAQHRVRD